MTLPITELVLPLCRLAADSEARLALLDSSVSGREVVGLHGTLDGPHCVHAHTLPTLFRLHAHRDPAGGQASAEVLVTDPCYWTPALPFLYNLVVELALAEGSLSTVTQTVGLRRWQADGPNLRLDRKRVVLRGAVESAADASGLPAARQCEAALVVRDPGEALCKEASRLGAALVADLRGLDRDLNATLLRFTWQPAIMLVLLDAEAAETIAPSPSHMLANVVHASDDDPVAGERSWASVIAVELAANERPPAWLAACGKPVIAIRRGAAYADFNEARAACDRLQAELAPEFNLAGYFVGNDE